MLRATRSGTVPGRRRRAAALVALLLVLEVGIVGMFLALDLVLFFVFFEVVLLPDVRGHRGLGRPATGGAAARKFVLYTLFGSVLLLVGVFAVVAGAGTADIVALTGAARPVRPAPSSPRSCCSRSRSR